MKKNDEKTRITAVGLISGGLDSLLAAKVLQSQGIDVLGITFSTPFWDWNIAIKAAENIEIPIHVVDISEEHLEMVKRPKYGYGSQMNPCIDCHGLMLRTAGKIMEQKEAHFIFTGEVLGQRPMSQRRDALRSVEKLSGYEGLILRPLSARLLPETEVEKRGLVKRELLLAIQGRSRKEQMKLAETYGLKIYSTPAGGCLLTKEGFSRKLNKLLELRPDIGVRHIEMLKNGRLCVLGVESLLFIGRNAVDNRCLETLAFPKDDIILKCVGIPGPIGVLCTSNMSEDLLYYAASIVASFSDAGHGVTTIVEMRTKENAKTIMVNPIERQYIDSMIIK